MLYLPFCHRWTTISVLVTSSICLQKDVSSNSVLKCNSNCIYGTEEVDYNGTMEHHNGTMEQQNIEMAMAERQWNGGIQA